jgi:ubiquinone/menaquinone biosynthesis C-methylase UbiE
MDDLLGRKLEGWRIKKVLPHIKGNLLDLGCGMNNLKSHYGSGIGVDIYDWGKVDVIVDDTSKLPFSNEKFDTITLLAALNHIPNREEVLKECHRILKSEGQIIITMIPPFISKIWHFIRQPWDKDQNERGMKEGEVYGFTKKEIFNLFTKAGFIPIKDFLFMLNINRVYI